MVGMRHSPKMVTKISGAVLVENILDGMMLE